VKEKTIESIVTLCIRAWARSVFTHVKWLVNSKQRGSMVFRSWSWSWDHGSWSCGYVSMGLGLECLGLFLGLGLEASSLESKSDSAS